MVQPVRGVLPEAPRAARARGAVRAVIPTRNAGEGALIRGLDVRTVGTLAELVRR